MIGCPRAAGYNRRVDSLTPLAAEVRKRLLEQYGQPSWRNPLPAIDELVSTILSQNTNDANRDRAFKGLIDRFPTWEAVRDADPEQVVEAIRPAGLANQKGPRIQQVLEQISAEHGRLSLDYLRKLPVQDARNELLRFKGVGPKTAAIVLLFSLGKPDFPVDTHIYRVTGRLGLRPELMSAQAAHQHLAEIFPSESYAEVHLNLIRHGREVCHARKPDCDVCFLSDLCAYYKHTGRDQPGVVS
jgi:endonuclease-3